MSLRDLVKLLIFILFCYLAWCTVKPWINKYFMQKAVESGAAYLTKHSIESTRQELTRRMVDEESYLNGNDFYLEKKENGVATVSVEYEDAIVVFGYDVKVFVFYVEATRAGTKKYL